MNLHHVAFTHMGDAHLHELRRQANLSRTSQARYPDREKQPRITRHWANR